MVARDECLTETRNLVGSRISYVAMGILRLIYSLFDIGGAFIPNYLREWVTECFQEKGKTKVNQNFLISR